MSYLQPMCVTKDIYRGPVVDIRGVRCSQNQHIYTQNQVITFELEQEHL